MEGENTSFFSSKGILSLSPFYWFSKPSWLKIVIIFGKFSSINETQAGKQQDRIRIQHILDEAGEACKYAEGIPFDEFVEDGKTVRAVIRSIEVIGEAASRISIEFCKEHPDVPWQKIIGMRNRLIHGYFDIDYNIIWQTVKENLPPLIDQLQSILEKKE